MCCWLTSATEIWYQGSGVVIVFDGVGVVAAMNETLAGELAEHRAHFRENRVLAAQLCDNLTAAQFSWRPEPGRWSIAECLVHLNISAKLFSQAIASAVNDARAAGLVGTGPFRYGPFSRWF